jgi:hypothetical protein
LIVLSFAHSVITQSFCSLGFTPPRLAQFCFTSLAELETNTPPTLFSIVAGQNTEGALNKTKVPTLSVFKACLAKNDEAQKEKKVLRKLIKILTNISI